MALPLPLLLQVGAVAMRHGGSQNCAVSALRWSWSWSAGAAPLKAALWCRAISDVFDEHHRMRAVMHRQVRTCTCVCPSVQS